jgi:hypothetical protein
MFTVEAVKLTCVRCFTAPKDGDALPPGAIADHYSAWLLVTFDQIEEPVK